DVKKVSHNVKDLMSQLLAEGLDTGGFIFDTALAAYLLDPTETNYTLSRISPRFLEKSLPDVQAAFELYPVLKQKLTEIQAEKLYFETELPLCQVLAEMEHTGFLVDRKALFEYGEGLKAGIDSLQAEIWRQAGQEFNINSPKQLGEILFDVLMLPPGKKTKTGWSTNADELEKLRGKHPVIQYILDYRELTKLKSTYADGLLKVMSSDGRIHTNFRMTVTATGRLSSTEPNLQNIPIRKELGGEIRKMFVAAPGMCLVDADYSQIELRLLSHISGDETMIKAFLDGEDIHRVTASQVFNIPLEEVTALQRGQAKAVNFGIIYGISAFSLSQDIGVWPSEAKAYIDAYLGKYHGVRDYMETVIAEAKRDGYVKTLYGRRRPLPELKSANYNTRSFGERVARNMPIQGTAADIIKLAMVNAHRRFKAEGLKSRLILQVHDELIAECPEEEAETAARILREEMENVASLSVPLTAEAGIGRSWAEAH
ncbi:MAG TPA: DNA polymerase I, partial [Clostridiales bacterium]|nr:DNA polymerase I [Clostridiales bacterium]